MKVTKIVFNDYKKDFTKPKAVCSIILDDCLKLNGVRLYSNEEGYYLVLPSCEDIYQKVEKLNPDLEITFPECVYVEKSRKKDYEEFYHPVSSSFYKVLLNSVVTAYEAMKKSGNHAYVVDK